MSHILDSPDLNAYETLRSMNIYTFIFLGKKKCKCCSHKEDLSKLIFHGPNDVMLSHFVTALGICKFSYLICMLL